VLYVAKFMQHFSPEIGNGSGVSSFYATSLFYCLERKLCRSSHNPAPPFLYTSCSLGLVWLISRTFSANEQYFSLTPNQSIVLSAIPYQPNKAKRTIGNESWWQQLVSSWSSGSPGTHNCREGSIHLEMTSNSVRLPLKASFRTSKNKLVSEYCIFASVSWC